MEDDRRAPITRDDKGGTLNGAHLIGGQTRKQRAEELGIDEVRSRLRQSLGAQTPESFPPENRRAEAPQSLFPVAASNGSDRGTEPAAPEVGDGERQAGAGQEELRRSRGRGGMSTTSVKTGASARTSNRTASGSDIASSRQTNAP